MTEAQFALVGHPVAHSLSPVIHEAAYASLGLGFRYGLVDCPDEQAVVGAVDALRAGRYLGLNVTLPHKRLALALADVVAESAAAVGAANVLCRSGQGVTAHNTDVVALVERFEHHAVSRGTAWVLGGGGAALAAVAALSRLGFSVIVVVARRFELAANRQPFERLGAQAVVPGDVVQGEGPPVTVVVQATSASATSPKAAEGVVAWVPWQRVIPQALCLDVVYVPEHTPFLTAARGRARIEGGLPMLIAQAACAIQLFTGRIPPRDVMQHAARAALREREGA